MAPKPKKPGPKKKVKAERKDDSHNVFTRTGRLYECDERDVMKNVNATRKGAARRYAAGLFLPALDGRTFHKESVEYIKLYEDHAKLLSRSGQGYECSTKIYNKIVTMESIRAGLWVETVDGGKLNVNAIESYLPKSDFKVDMTPKTPPPPEEPKNPKEVVKEVEQGPPNFMKHDKFLELCRKHNFLKENGRVDMDSLSQQSGLELMKIRFAVQEGRIGKDLAAFMEGL